MDRRIDPRGTARLLFERFQGGAAEPFLEELLTNLEAAQDSGRSLVYLAHELAQLPRGLAAQEREALTLLGLSLLLAGAQGSSRLPADFSGEAWSALLPVLLRNKPGGWDVQSAREAMGALLRDARLDEIFGRDPAAYKPVVHVDGCLYPQRMFRLEAAVATAIQKLTARGPAAFDEQPLRQAVAEVFAPDTEGRQLDPNQQYAALSAAHLPLTLISGGPGTGKTTIVVAILRLLVRLQPGVSIALAAPTGKAAFRMKESIAQGLGRAGAPAADVALANALPEPATLHRLLGASADGRTFRHNEFNRLPCDVVIVDEASMIDLALIDRLLRALPEHGQLVLLGDADQLPSVDAGAVLRDLVPAGFQAMQPWRALVTGALAEDHAPAAHPMQACAIRLQKTHRQSADAAGAAIRAFAARAREGQANALFSDPDPAVARAGLHEVAFQGVEHVAANPEGDEEHEASLHDFCDRWYADHVQAVGALTSEPFQLTADGWAPEALPRLCALFAHHEARKILCVSRVLPSGSQQINRMLHDRFAEKLRQRMAPWFAGEPVIMLHNDYDREIFNGDQGVIVQTAGPDGAVALAAAFRRGDRFIPISTAVLGGGLDLGYAMTVHKSQGSEFDHVALVLPRVDIALATREIIYTAVTRAKRSVLVFGDRVLLEAAVRRRVTRYSGLQDRLRF